VELLNAIYEQDFLDCSVSLRQACVVGRAAGC